MSTNVGQATRLRRAARGRLRRVLVERMGPAERLILANRYVAGKYFPLARSSAYACAILDEGPTDAPGADGLPVPPEHLWFDYARTADEYVRTGQNDVQTMLGLLQAAGASSDELRRVLDVGCAAGRMLRAFPGEAERWGVDISASHIDWCERNLNPPLRFATTTSAPHLPFEDGSFDLAWCGSVFTHIAELATAWLLELKRVLRPGGWLYVTVHTKHSVELLSGRYRHDPLMRAFAESVISIPACRQFPSSGHLALVIGTDPDSQVFYDAEGLARRWSAFLRVVSLTEEAHDYQAAVILQKT